VHAEQGADGSRFNAVLLAIAVLALPSTCAGAISTSARRAGRFDAASPWLNRKRITEADEGMVAADDERCSQIGRDSLLAGGNAVDAAVATALCLGVVNPVASGIGGGSFLLLRLANGTAVAYDMRETAPAAAHQASLLLATFFSLLHLDISHGVSEYTHAGHVC
jgi:hypothetical protein